MHLHQTLQRVLHTCATQEVPLTGSLPLRKQVTPQGPSFASWLEWGSFPVPGKNSQRSYLKKVFVSRERRRNCWSCHMREIPRKSPDVVSHSGNLFALHCTMTFSSDQLLCVRLGQPEEPK